MDKVLLALLIIFAVLIVLVFSARTKIARLYKKYLTVGNSLNITGKTLAELSVDKLNLPHLNLAITETPLADAYVSKTKTLILSNAVCNYASLTSLTVVAHELGHAVQDRQNNRLFGLVQILGKITRLTNKLVMPLLVVGLAMYGLGYFNLISASAFSTGLTLSYLSFLLFLFAIVVKLTTIPLEYDASKKGLAYLKDYGFLTKSEIRHAKKLLSVAALTYIASLFDGILVLGEKFRSLISKKTKKHKK